MTVDWESEQRTDHHNPTKQQKNKRGRKPWKEANKKNPQYNRSQPKSKSPNKPTESDKPAILVDPTMEIDRKLPPKLKTSLHVQASSTHHIKGLMGRDRPSPPINSEDLETNWHLFELTIAVEERNDQQQQGQPMFQPTKLDQLHSSMALKMRGSINDPSKAKSRVAMEAKRKAVEEEKKLSTLQQCLSKIRKARLDEHNWPKYWIEMKEWEKSENARNITVAKIKSYLNAPIIDNFGTLKEEAVKFLVSSYHDGKIWLDQPITINRKLIKFITSLPLNGEPVPIGSKNPTLLEKFTGSTQRGKNSKGLQINSIESSSVRWEALIISICPTISDWSSDVKLYMLEAIDEVANHAKTCSWASYLADLVKSNCEKCQEQGTPIIFCSLLIWIEMSRMSPVGHPDITNLSGPSMYNYSCFKIKAKDKGEPSPKEMFAMWLQQIKSAFHKWRVPQNIHRSLPPTCHIKLGLDYTKLWYVDGHAVEPVELTYYPMVDQIFGELTQQSNTITPIPTEAREIQVDLLFPLIDGEKVEQHEAELQMQSFVSEA